MKESHLLDDDLIEIGVLLNFDKYKYFLIYNDLAEALITKDEKILRNKYGTWWLVVDDEQPLNKNKALVEITRETMEKGKNDGK